MRLVDIKRLLVLFFVIPLLAVIPILAVGESQNFDKSYLGITMHFDDAGGGILVEGVAPESPAEKSGLKVGDLITSINGESIWFENDLELVYFLEQFRPGDRLELTVRRSGATQRIEVVAGTRSEEATERLALWKAKAAGRLKEGKDIYSCDDNEQVAAPRGKASPRWGRFLRSVTSERKFVVVKDPTSSEILLKEDVASEGVLPDLRFEDLGMAWTAFANDLKPGDSFTLKVTYHPEDRSSTIEPEDLPSYVMDNMQSYVKALTE